MLPMKLKVPLNTPVSNMAINPLLQETNEDMKARLFNLHEKNLNNLIQKDPGMFKGVKITKKDGRIINLYAGLKKIYSLFNHELVNYSHSELTDFLDKELKKV